MDRYITWVRLGSYLLAGGTATLLAVPAQADDTARTNWLQVAESGEGGEGAEGGEGSEGGGSLDSYSLSSTDPNAFKYDAAAEIAGYADLVHESYEAAYREAEKLDRAIDALLDTPTEETLAAARNAWINARPAYLMTEAFRFYDGPIDVSAEGGDGPEGRINSWPMNEAVIDYVQGGEEGGLIADTSKEITEEVIVDSNQVNDEADVTTGWHAIEFLLWGQDLSATGPGARPASDFVAGDAKNDRRRQYLQIVTHLLVEDLEGLADQWAPGAGAGGAGGAGGEGGEGGEGGQAAQSGEGGEEGGDGADGAAGAGGNYRATFLALPQREAIGRIFAGIAQLAGFEMASERLAVALDSGSQEDEHSCFSDNTTFDHIFDLQGIRNVWFGSVTDHQFPGLIDAATRVDPVAAAMVTARLNAAQNALEAIDRPFDRVLASPKGSPAREEAEHAVKALGDLATALQEMGAKMGVLVLVGG